MDSIVNSIFSFFYPLKFL